MIPARIVPRLRTVPYILLAAAVYGICNFLNVRFASTVDQATLLWFPSGLALALCFRLGPACAIGLWLGGFAVSALRNPVLPAATVGGGVALAAWTGATLLRRAGFDDRLISRRDVLVFVSLGVLGSTPISATVATAGMLAGGALYRPTAWEVWREWWLGDAAGVLVVAPPLLLWSRAEARSIFRGRWVEATGLAVALVVVAYAVFFDRLGPVSREVVLVFLTFPLIVWASLRFEAIGATTAVLILTTMAIWGTALDHGPLLGPDVTVRLGLLWAYIGASSAVGLLMTAIEAERNSLLHTLSESEARNRDLIEQASDAIYVTDTDGVIVTVNQQCENLVGYSREELVGRPAWEIVSPEDRARLAATPPQKEPGERAVSEWRILRKDGVTRWVEASSTVLSDGRRQGILRDITARREAEAALATSRTRERLLMDQVPAMLWTADREGRVTSAVGSGLTRLGLSANEVVGQPIARFIAKTPDPALVLASMERAQADEPQTFETCWGDARLQCDVRPLRDGTGHITGTIGVAVDITELVELQEQVQQAQKIESVGELAGGIAHDFNNLLQVIQGYTLLAREGSDSEAERREHLAQVLGASERASQLTGQLLTFARRQPLEVSDVDLVDLVSHMLNLIRRLIGEDIDVRVEARVPAAYIRCDRAQIEQVLLNLCLNARDARPRDGRIDVIVDERADPSAGRTVRLIVHDEGVGMDKATLDRIFEPFFTTKPQGSGTGLGLSVVYGIVRQHGGQVHVDSAPGVGTTFTVSFPAGSVAPVSPGLEESSEAVGGSETVLLAEDEPSVRELAVRVLSRAGYRVLVAEDGAEAVRLFEEHDGTIDLLVIDVVMPRCGGVEAYARMSARRPGLPALFCSGYAAMAERGQSFPEDLTLLSKPYTPDQLLRSVRERLQSVTK